MHVNKEKLNNLIIKLHEIGGLKFGDFKMKIGVNSPVYLDLRIIVSYPDILEELTELICESGKSSIKNCDHICGVPYAALSVSTLVAVRSHRPMLIRRKEAKNYGTKKIIEGIFQRGDSCIIIEDVVTSGLSILETVADLHDQGLNVKEAIVIVDREQGGAALLKEKGITMKSLVTLSGVMEILLSAGKISNSTVEQVRAYLKQSHITVPAEKIPLKPVDRLQMPFEVRAEKAKNKISSMLLQLMADKSTCLCVAADLTNANDILQLAEVVGPYICVLKTHVDIISDFSETFVKELKALSKKHNFLIMEDRKFGDIGHTAGLQYGGGIYNIAKWADLVTVHPVSGPGVIDGLYEVLETLQAEQRDKACFIVADMSSEGTLTDNTYRIASLKMAMDRNDFVAGVVTQSCTGLSDPGLIQLTPGVRAKAALSSDSNGSGDGLGQQYNSPSHVILEKGADLAVVGRGITQADDKLAAAKFYRDTLWKSYLQRINAEQ